MVIWHQSLPARVLFVVILMELLSSPSASRSFCKGSTWKKLMHHKISLGGKEGGGL